MGLRVRIDIGLGVVELVHISTNRNGGFTAIKTTTPMALTMIPAAINNALKEYPMVSLDTLRSLRFPISWNPTMISATPTPMRDELGPNRGHCSS